MAVVVETTLGDFAIDLYIKERPRTCLNFLKLCKVKYYNFCTFHKIEHNFVAQTGDPTGTGRGGESVFSMLYGEQAKFFDAESTPRLKHRKLGTVSMVNNGDNVHGSQFFITLGEDLDYLDGVHTVFGEVTEGLDVLVKLNDAICDENHRPYQDILITHTVILDDPFEDPKGLIIPAQSPEPTDKHLKSSRIGATEDIDDTKGKSLEEIEEEIKIKEAKARATILEMIGDIPDAEVRPPDNVLFVCKLNPVTTAEDLEIIFSRFGLIKSCEVICDKKTGESLQYAFIEFDKPEDCENAYFKMDNVLIDDRRIHVDFSQSVSKLKWKGQNIGKSASQKSEEPNYVIKEKAQSKKDERYQMLFDDDDDMPSKTTLSEPVEEKISKASPRKRTKKKHKKKKTSNEESNCNRHGQKKEKVQKIIKESSDSDTAKRNKVKKCRHRSSSGTSSDSDCVKEVSKEQKKKSKLPAAYRYSNEPEKRHSRQSVSSPVSPENRQRNRPSGEKRGNYDRLRSKYSRSRSRSRSKSHSQGYRRGRESQTRADSTPSNRPSPFSSVDRRSERRFEERNRKAESRSRNSRNGHNEDKSPPRSYRSPVRSSRQAKDRRTNRRSRSRS